MADSQAQLSLGVGDATAKVTGLMVIGAVALLFVLRRFNVSVSAGK